MNAHRSAPGADDEDLRQVTARSIPRSIGVAGARRGGHPARLADLLEVADGAARRGVATLHRAGPGSRVWDLDGNEYIDFMNGLLAISPRLQRPRRGRRRPGPDSSSGVTFSLPHPIETEVAELIVELVPCAELVRFGKNGSDATAGAIRVARAYTGRDRVAVCGYHGWQDWYIGSTTSDLGVPAATKALTHRFGTTTSPRSRGSSARIRASSLRSSWSR